MTPLRSRLTLAAGSALAFGLVLASPPMVSTADGCAGGGAVEAWNSAEYAPGTVLPTDGLVVIRGHRNSLAVASAPMTVTVTDSSAQPVPGSLSMEAVEPNRGYAVWRPAAPLQAGASYTVAWHFEQPYTDVDDSASFSTTSGVSLLSDLDTTMPKLQRTYALSGALVYCYKFCDHYLGSKEITPYGMTFTVLPPKDPYTFQALSLREVPGKGTFVETYDTPLQRPRGMMATPWLEPAEFSVLFEEVLPEYCVELVQRDLRNGLERTKQLCVARTDLPPEGGVTLDMQLQICVEPPENAELAKRWCKLNPQAVKCQYLYGDAGPNDAGDAGSNTDASPSNDAASPADSSSCSCRTPSREPDGVPHAALLLLLAPGVRRWRRRRA